MELGKGEIAVGRRVRLPRGAEPPIVVYINGVAQVEGEDYELRGGEVVFKRQIVKEQVSGGRWLAMFLGLFGTYRQNDSVDVQYTFRGQDRLATALDIVPPPGQEPTGKS